MSTPFIGETRIFAFSFAPPGWMICEGQLLAISDYDELFQLIGTTYGGDGESNFALPSATGPESDDGATLTVCIAVNGDWPQSG